MRMDRFADVLARWQQTEGRQTLPWQKYSTPYERLVSEVMLQQTQVETVIPYYERFLQRFPNVESLAQSVEDDVFALWAGLGYYTRASNLRKAAQYVVHDLDGVFPTDFDGLLRLPGVGPSTAAAVAAFTSAQATHPMIDGNVKRVLSRVFLIEGRIGEPSFEKMLEARARQELPGPDLIGAYTQGLMDLGAGICKRLTPDCKCCPMAARCEAHRLGVEKKYPGRRLAPKRTTLRMAMAFVIDDAGGVWLRKVDRSIWRGLWTPLWEAWPASMKRSDEDEEKTQIFLSGIRERLAGDVLQRERRLPAICHDLTHRRLLIEPHEFLVAKGVALEGCERFPLNALPGMPKPVVQVLSEFGLE